MTETSTVTMHQRLIDKLGTSNPQEQLLKVIERLEKLENPVKLTAAERMAKARAARGKK